MKVRHIGKNRKTTRSKQSWSRYIHHRARHLKAGTIIETCGCDVARIIHTDVDCDDVEYESLTTGYRGSCSIYNCGPMPLSAGAVKRRLELFEQGGKDALTKRYYVEDCKMSPEDADKQIAEWKNLTLC